MSAIFSGHDWTHVLSIATKRLDRRMDSLMETYQGIFAGTRIATVGFAMGTAVLALQLLFLRASESMGNHDSNVVGAGRVG
jgi:hypothetical protein